MSVLKEKKVVMLPTDEKAINQLILGKKHTKYENRLAICCQLNADEEHMWQFQHLYFLSDEKIEDGDWILGYGAIHKCDSVEANNANKDDYCKKIIATTDSSLGIENVIKTANQSECEIGSSGWIKIKNENLLPQPSQSFVEKFVENYNKGKEIKKVLVEYIYIPGSKIEADPKIRKEGFGLQLKVNPVDNTITIKSVKNIWNREEQEELIDKVLRDFRTECLPFGQVIDAELIKFRDNWIEENL